MTTMNNDPRRRPAQGHSKPVIEQSLQERIPMLGVKTASLYDQRVLFGDTASGGALVVPSKTVPLEIDNDRLALNTLAAFLVATGIVTGSFFVFFFTHFYFPIIVKIAVPTVFFVFPFAIWLMNKYR